MPRFQTPPNWPAPPSGWTPPPGWQPDPAWGPPPVGWQFWLPDAPALRDSSAFWRTGILAGVAIWLTLILQTVLGATSAYAFGSAVGSAVLPWLLVSLVAHYSGRRWSWPVLTGVFFGAWLVLGMASLLNNAALG